MIYFFLPQGYHIVEVLSLELWSSSGHVKGPLVFVFF
jgi:hypothetical protein